MVLSIWPKLPIHLQSHIISYLSLNEIACTVRLINQASATYFSEPQYKTVRLTQPVPEQAFAIEFGADSPRVRSLTSDRRAQVLRCTAASGVQANLALAVHSMELDITEADLGLLESAASGGQWDVHQWLVEQGCPMDQSLLAAAEAGQCDFCDRWLATYGTKGVQFAVYAAARGGHVALFERLLRQLPKPKSQVNALRLLEAAAKGCDLVTLQRLHETWLSPQRLPENPSVRGEAATSAAATLLPPPHQQPLCQRQHHQAEDWRRWIMEAAVCSSTPDWQAKVEWLEQRGYPRAFPYDRILSDCCDAADRLRWLRQRGHPMGRNELSAAVNARNPSAVRFLLEEVGVRLQKWGAFFLDGGPEQLSTLKLLHAYGCQFMNESITAAARSGNVEMVQWLVEVLGVGREELATYANPAAAESGNLPMLVWLQQRGCLQGPGNLGAVVGRGWVEGLEWLVKQGHQLPNDGSLYYLAAQHRSLPMLRCLRRLGCPWGPPDVTDRLLELVLSEPASLGCFRFLAAEGCPVDWDSALKQLAAQHSSRQLISWMVEGMLLQQQQQQQRWGQGTQAAVGPSMVTAQ